ncbi:TetR/AcrR family transcriptional regulator [Candidimonas nitroreducens]|nr:TetR/AcrR family transcriptional regulator [Candidimonas nitroreducens]
MILDGAIRYFAEAGFHGQTRELASRLGITNSLLFRYFPTKDDLVEQVYQQVYVGRWQADWEHLLLDDSQTLRNRLRGFYKSYLSVIYSYEWVRIFFFAGLRGVNIKSRYLKLLEVRVIEPICIAIRREYRLADPATVPLSSLERDAVWGLQGQVLYICVRRFVYDQDIRDPEQIMDAAIDVFLAGIAQVARKAISRSQAAARGS